MIEGFGVIWSQDARVKAIWLEESWIIASQVTGLDG